MELEDAIIHARDVATGKHDGIDRCSECAKEHGQLANWLEELQRYKQAERDGRLFTPHCKIGDTVYIPDVENGIAVPVRVQGISIAVSGRVLLHFGGYPAECAWDHDCGKGWYKTREAAEKALEEANG